MEKKKSKKKIIIIVAVVVVLLAIFGALGGKDDKKSDSKLAPTEEKKENKEEKDDTLVTTWTTKTGQECKVYTEAPLDYRAAAKKTIEDLAPDADVEKLNGKDGWSFSLYDDGMAQISTPSIYRNGYEYGSTIMMNFKDDSHTDYEVHYLKIGPDTLRDDGTFVKDDYAEAE